MCITLLFAFFLAVTLLMCNSDVARNASHISGLGYEISFNIITVIQYLNYFVCLQVDICLNNVFGSLIVHETTETQFLNSVSKLHFFPCARNM